MHRIAPFCLTLLALPTGLFGLLACAGEAPETSESTGGLVITNPGEDERDYFYDFGEIPDGTKVSHTFILENTDSVPVTIQDMQPACSCTMPVISYRDEAGELVRGKRFEEPVITLPPGALAELVIEVDTNHVKMKNVDKLTAVMLRCDSVNTPYMRFEMHLIATSAYQVTPEKIDLGDVPISSGGRGQVDIITGVPGSLFRILGLAEKSEGLEVQVSEREGLAEPLWRVDAALLPPLEFGQWRGEIVLNSTGSDGAEDGPPLHVQVIARVVPDVVVYPTVLGFTPGPEGAGLSAVGTLTALAPGHRVKIVDALLQGQVPESFRVAYEAISPDAEGRSQRWQVSVEASGPISAPLLTGSVQLTLDDPALDPVEVTFVYRK